MNNMFFILIDDKCNVIRMESSHYSLSRLCDYARDLSIENNNVIIIYQLFILKPYSYKKLYKFNCGKLILTYA